MPKSYKGMINETANRGRLRLYAQELDGIQCGTDDAPGDYPDYIIRLNANNARIFD